MALQVQLGSGDVVKASTDVLAVLVSRGALSSDPLIAALDQALGGSLLDAAKAAQFEGKAEQTLELSSAARLRAKRVLLIGVGEVELHDRPRRGKRRETSELSPAVLRSAVATAARASDSQNARTLTLALGSTVRDFRTVGEGVVLGAYRFTRYLTGDRLPKARLGRVLVVIGRAPTRGEKLALALGTKLAEAVCLARDAVNEPPNQLTPHTLALLARSVAAKNGLRINVLDKKGIARAGMHLHYAVGQGSVNEPRFIHMSYRPRARAAGRKKIAFVGKGLTFDSGGLCIKPAAGMGEMKSDMGGAAAVLGLMAGLGVLKPNVEVHGIIGAAENMPDGAAFRPGDVFGSLDGKTVEIINTDAEGRLVLADALTYASRLRPDVVVDAATLTGAIVVALGKTYTGLYATDETLAEHMSAAAEHAGEGFWRMPLLDELKEQLKSDVADLKHTGDRWGGSITAALFLREFVSTVPWMHCDIAGPALSDRARGVVPKGGTGHGVLTFLSFVERLASA